MTSSSSAAASSSSSSSLYEGPIIDAHVHYWDPCKTPREVTPLVKLLGWNAGLCNWTAMRIFPEQALYFFSSPRYFTKPHLPADYNKDVGTQQQYVEGIVHVEAAWTGKNPVDERKRRKSLINDVTARAFDVNATELPTTFKCSGCTMSMSDRVPVKLPTIHWSNSTTSREKPFPSP